MTIVVATTDWHLDARTAGAPRRDDLSKAVDASAARAIELHKQGHDVVYIFGGDLADPWRAESHAAVATAVRTACKLNRAGVSNLWIVGNHDVIEDGSGDHALLALSALEDPLTRVCSYPQVYSLGAVNILALPYPSLSRAYDPTERVQLISKGLHSSKPMLIAGHLTLNGLIPGSESTEMPKGKEVVWPLATIRQCFPDATIIAGHHHHAQMYEGVHVIGSLGRLTFADATHSPCWLEMEF